MGEDAWSEGITGMALNCRVLGQVVSLVGHSVFDGKKQGRCQLDNCPMLIHDPDGSR